MSKVSNSQRTSEEEYRNIFESISDGLVIYDIGLNSVVEANPAACTMHGYIHQEFIGLNPAVFMLAENHVQFRDQTHKAKLGDVYEALAIHMHKDGTTFHVEERRSVIDYRGRRCLLSVIRDVSQRIQTEKILG